jgi:hypothetical protein
MPNLTTVEPYWGCVVDCQSKNRFLLKSGTIDPSSPGVLTDSIAVETNPLEKLDAFMG